MSKKVKILLVLLGVLVLTSVGFIIWQQKTQASEEAVTAQQLGGIGGIIGGAGDISRKVEDVGRTINAVGGFLKEKEVDGKLQGKVKEEGVKEGGKDKVIANVKVSAVGMDEWGINPSIPKLEGVTNSKGEYKISPAKSSTVYLLTFEAEGYITSYGVSQGKKFTTSLGGLDKKISEEVNASLKRGVEGSIGGDVTYKGLPLSVKWPGGLGAIEFNCAKRPAEVPQVFYSAVFSNRAQDSSYKTYYYGKLPVGSYEGTASIINYPDTKSDMQPDGTTGQPIPVSFQITKGARTTLNLEFLKKSAVSTPPGARK